MIEKPGAHTRWNKVNQLLAPDERFELLSPKGKNFLLAPKHASQLAALLYILHQEGIDVSVQGGGFDAPALIENSVIISVRAFSQLIWYEQGVVEAGAGSALSYLHQFLFEKNQEVALDGDPLASSKRSVGSLILSGSMAGVRYRSEGVPENILGVELVTWEGSQIKWGGPYRTALAGPALHKLIWGLQTLPGIIVKVILKTYPIPQARLRLVWSFRQKEDLWKQWDDLKRFSLSWEYLDAVLSGCPEDQCFIFAQISGLSEEIEAFSKNCPCYNAARQQEERVHLKKFLIQQKLKVFPVPVHHSLESGEYLWIQEGNQNAWWLTGRANGSINDSVPIWKKRFRNSFNKMANDGR